MLFRILMYLGGGCYGNHSFVKHSSTGKNLSEDRVAESPLSMKLNQEPPEMSIKNFTYRFQSWNCGAPDFFESLPGFVNPRLQARIRGRGKTLNLWRTISNVIVETLWKKPITLASMQASAITKSWMCSSPHWGIFYRENGRSSVAFNPFFFAIPESRGSMGGAFFPCCVSSDWRHFWA